MTDNPPPYPGIQPGYGYASGLPHQGVGAAAGQPGAPGWANPNYKQLRNREGLAKIILYVLYETF